MNPVSLNTTRFAGTFQISLPHDDKLKTKIMQAAQQAIADHAVPVHIAIVKTQNHTEHWNLDVYGQANHQQTLTSGDPDLYVVSTTGGKAKDQRLFDEAFFINLKPTLRKSMFWTLKDHLPTESGSKDLSLFKEKTTPTSPRFTYNPVASLAGQSTPTKSQY